MAFQGRRKRIRGSGVGLERPSYQHSDEAWPGLFINIVASGRKLFAGKEGKRFDRRRIEIRAGSKREA